MKKRSGKRKKIIDWQKKAHKEKVLIAVLMSVTVLLAFYIGYDIYDSLQTKTETETQISYLNGAIVSLNQERDQLTSERDTLDQTVDTLTQQKAQLTTDNAALTSDLDTLEEDYDACSVDLEEVEDDLDACESP